jgi:hypothetical protein
MVLCISGKVSHLKLVCMVEFTVDQSKLILATNIHQQRNHCQHKALEKKKATVVGVPDYSD